MWKVLIPLCAASVLVSLPARSAVPEEGTSERRASFAASPRTTQGMLDSQQSMWRWFLGVGGVSLLATVRTRSLLRCRRDRLQRASRQSADSPPHGIQQT